ncbi:Fatty acid desaturase [Candidatus Bartonella washoeensis]|uniref:Fatty acid desaturase domain-containing protein n=1 Tax=Candidatus Bartonella washoeensis Sb944nv TaxID=1094563 RepID=J0Q5K2_9HYPH|nr:fatty acid desaturase [Bartonella washoeensis]EJF77894.1 hypothetical protein MCQ_01337 [Bartonella washoeensis Sb944nv]SPU27555.1 Fatty acid desaturase [Bartonella washoeensis]
MTDNELEELERIHLIAIKPHLKELSERKSYKGLGRLLIMVFVYLTVLLLAIKFDSIYTWIFADVLLGLLFSGLFSVMHYCGHGTLLASRKLNRILGTLFSMPILMNFSLYKFFHFVHHQRTSQLGDTEPKGELNSFPSYFLALSNLDFIYGFFRLSIASLFNYRSFFIKNRKQLNHVKLDTIFLLGWIVFIAFVTFYYPKFSLMGYWLPLQIGLSFNFYTSFAEHYECSLSKNKLSNTRTVYLKSRILKYFLFNSNYHAEHHFLPSVPPWNLPKVNFYIKESLQHTQKSYYQIHKEQLKKIVNRQQRPAETNDGFVKNFNFKLEKL